MAPSWSEDLWPVCLGAVSVQQTALEHICTPRSSAEASPDTQEQAGLFSAPRLSAKFPALLETCGRALLWQGRRERTRQGKEILCFQLVFAGICSWVQERGARLH